MSQRKTSFIKRHIILIIACLSLLVTSLYIYYQQEVAMVKMKRELSDYQATRHELEEAIKVLEREVDRLSDDKLKESLARKKLNMIRPDEIIYTIKFDDEVEQDDAIRSD